MLFARFSLRVAMLMGLSYSCHLAAGAFLTPAVTTTSAATLNRVTFLREQQQHVYSENSIFTTTIPPKEAKSVQAPTESVDNHEQLEEDKEFMQMAIDLALLE